ncbi:MAG: GatB/YqeY domain-containing protein, partial [Ottowia sp.]|nr:GatB/YqeY domain-containing protein [Ottowia sp.]
MNLAERINEDMKAAMRAKDSARLDAIRMLRAAIKQKEVDGRAVLDDAGIVAVIDKLAKQRRDSIDAFRKAGRQDLVDKESAELALLESYLPARLSAEEVAAEVQALLAELGAAGPADWRPDTDKWERTTAERLAALEAAVPYDTWLFPDYHDDEVPSTRLADAFAAWNEKWATPVFRTVGSLDEPFERLERRWGDRIPVLRGDLPCAWD